MCVGGFSGVACGSIDAVRCASIAGIDVAHVTHTGPVVPGYETQDPSQSVDSLNTRFSVRPALLFHALIDRV